MAAAAGGEEAGMGGVGDVGWTGLGAVEDGGKGGAVVEGGRGPGLGGVEGVWGTDGALEEGGRWMRSWMGSGGGRDRC